MSILWKNLDICTAMPRSLIYWSLGILLSSVVLFPAMPMIYLDLQVSLHRSYMHGPHIQTGTNVDVFVFPAAALRAYQIDDHEMVYKDTRYDIVEIKQIGLDSFEISAVRDSYEDMLLERMADLHGSKKNDDPLIVHLMQPDWSTTSLPQLNAKLLYISSDLVPRTHNLRSTLAGNCWYPPPDQSFLL